MNKQVSDERIIEICEYYFSNSNETLQEIALRFSVHKSTISLYLTQYFKIKKINNPNHLPINL